MNDEEAEGYVAMILQVRRGEPYEVTVGLGSVPAVTRAFARAGFLAEPTDRPGRLRIEPAPKPPTDGVEALRRTGKAVLRALRDRKLEPAAAARMLETSEVEMAHLWAGRFDEIGLASLCHMAERLRVGGSSPRSRV